jgi:hypothetical protein
LNLTSIQATLTQAFGFLKGFQYYLVISNAAISIVHVLHKVIFRNKRNELFPLFLIINQLEVATKSLTDIDVTLYFKIAVLINQ